MKMDESTPMDIDENPARAVEVDTSNDEMLARRIQLDEYERANAYRNSVNNTENDIEIARILEENFRTEQQIWDILMGKAESNESAQTENAGNKKLQKYLYDCIQKEIKEKQLKEKPTFEIFRMKLNMNEALPIQEKIRKFNIDFANKTNKHYFKNPNEQSKYLRRFIPEILNDIYNNILWINESLEEKENTKLNTEKLITKRLYDITFCPPEDNERDIALSKIINMHSWVEPKHLELPDFEDMIFRNASNELIKMNEYKFYKDKIICLNNCVQYIERAYRSISETKLIETEQILSILTYIILKTNPKKLISNIEYIQRYSNPEELEGKTNFNMTNICFVISFIEKISKESFYMNDEDYDEKIKQMTETETINIKKISDENTINNDDYQKKENKGVIMEMISRILNPLKLQNTNQYPGNVTNTQPFADNLNDEDKKNLRKTDNNLTTSMSINSNVGRSESESSNVKRLDSSNVGRSESELSSIRRLNSNLGRSESEFSNII